MQTLPPRASRGGAPQAHPHRATRGADSGACPFFDGRAQPGQLLGAPSEALGEALAGVGAAEADPWEAARRPATWPQAVRRTERQRAWKGVRCRVAAGHRLF